MQKKHQISSSSIFSDASTNPPLFAKPAKPAEPNLQATTIPLETAIVYCEGHFGGIYGKTANGLVRHSEKYKILSIIDDNKEGQDAGVILDGVPNGVPVYRDLGTALAHAGRRPKNLIFGITPATGELSLTERRLLLRAIKYGINIVTRLHQSLSGDPEFAAACSEFGVVIRDV
jgi:uncharacterized NAD-dependent epimerase/dehydratase family protein